LRSTLRAAQRGRQNHISIAFRSWATITCRRSRRRLCRASSRIWPVGDAHETQRKTFCLSSLLKTARSWGYACGDFRFADLALPREGIKAEPRSFTDAEVRKIISNASEPLSTIVAVTAVLGLCIGENLALPAFDVDSAKHVIRVRQSVGAATRTVCGVKSRASSADLPISRQLEARLRTHLQRHAHKNELLFVNGRGRPFSANELREKQLHALLDVLGIPRGGFHSMRHGAASSLLAAGATPVMQELLRHADVRTTMNIYTRAVPTALRVANSKVLRLVPPAQVA